jgi:hypothetical protein
LKTLFANFGKTYFVQTLKVQKPTFNQHRGEREIAMNSEGEWTVYRTRFLVRARQLTEPLIFTDALGREQSGEAGDYVVESSDGITRITSKALFEDIYVPLISGLLLPSVPSLEKAVLQTRITPTATTHVIGHPVVSRGSPSVRSFPCA